MNGNILIVENRKRPNDALTLVLRRAGHRVARGGDAVQALVQLQTHDYDAVVCEHALPHMTGVELLEQVRDRAPDAQRFLVSDAPDHGMVLDAINRAEVHGFLRGAADEDELLLALELACERASQSRENRWLLAMARDRTRRVANA